MSELQPVPERPQRNCDPETLVAETDQSTVRALFYLFTGKPDSKTQLYTRRIIVRSQDILELDRRILEKLSNHQISGVVTSVVIRFCEKKAADFGHLDHFKNFNWAIGERTHQITIKWDFLVQLPLYGAPQRHTLTVKVTPSMTPMEFMRVVFSHNPEELDHAEIEHAICVARIDFLNYVLADELLNVVDSWNDGVRRHPTAHDWFGKLERFDAYISRGIQYSLTLMTFVVCLTAFRRLTHELDPSLAIVNSTIVMCFYWLGWSAAGLFVVSRVGKYIGYWAYRTVNA
jgi:hypothetical protein